MTDSAARLRLHHRDAAEAARRNAGAGAAVSADVADDTTTHDVRNHAFRTQVMPELELLYAMAMRLTRNPHDAEDLVQDTLVRAVGALDRFDGRHPRAWLLTILRNTHINRATKMSPDLMHDPDATLRRLRAGDPGGGVAETALGRIPDEATLGALADLSVDHRAVVALVDVDGLSYREAAELLGIPEGTVMSRLHRARRNLRDHLAATSHLDRDRATRSSP